jgi:hypothetical protein
MSITKKVYLGHLPMSQTTNTVGIILHYKIVIITVTDRKDELDELYLCKILQF